MEQLTKVTAYLVPAALEAMHDAARRFRQDRTETVNRALIAYERNTSRFWTFVRRTVLLSGIGWPLLLATPNAWPWQATVPAIMVISVAVGAWIEGRRP